MTFYTFRSCVSNTFVTTRADARSKTVSIEKNIQHTRESSCRGSLRGDKVSMLSHMYPHKPLRKIELIIRKHHAGSPLYVWPIVWSGDLQFQKKYGHTKCPYWDQVSLNNTSQTKPNHHVEGTWDWTHNFDWMSLPHEWKLAPCVTHIPCWKDCFVPKARDQRLISKFLQLHSTIHLLILNVSSQRQVSGHTKSITTCKIQNLFSTFVYTPVVLDNHPPREPLFSWWAPDWPLPPLYSLRKWNCAPSTYNRHLTFGVAFICSTLMRHGVCDLRIWRLNFFSSNPVHGYKCCNVREHLTFKMIFLPIRFVAAWSRVVWISQICRLTKVCFW